MSEEGKWVVWEAEAHLRSCTARDSEPGGQLASAQTRYDNSVPSTSGKTRHY